MKNKANYPEKFKVGQKVRYIGSTKIVEFLKKSDNIFTIDEVINYNDVHGWYPQCVELKWSASRDEGECRYLIGGRWNVSESELVAA